MNNQSTKFQKGQRVKVIGILTGKIRNIRFDDRNEAIYDIFGDNGEYYVARDCELKDAQ